MKLPIRIIKDNNNQNKVKVYFERLGMPISLNTFLTDKEVLKFEKLGFKIEVIQ